MYCIEHTTSYNYSESPKQAIQRMHLMPRSCPGQTVREWVIHLEGSEVMLSCNDHHGNIVHIAAQTKAKSEIVITASGMVETEDTSGVLGPHDNLLPLALYKKETYYCRMGPSLKMLSQEIPEKVDDVKFLHGLSQLIARKITYKKGHTDSLTPAEVSTTLGLGVCQDHVHVFLTLARYVGFAARYVSGYMVTNTEDLNTESHAWAEVYLKGIGWVGFDISNQISPDEKYVRIASGFDYSDVQPVAGLRFGDGEETMTTQVIIQ